MKKENKKTILVVEDEKLLRKMLVETLLEEGYRVLEAENGQQGLKLALKNHPRLILLDVMMPVMDGMTMLKLLREDEWGKDVFVYMLTNKDPDKDLISEASRTPYVSAYLIKSEYGIGEIMKMIKDKLKELDKKKKAK